MKLLHYIVISLFILTSLLVGSLSYGQHKSLYAKKQKPCYCDSISLIGKDIKGYNLSQPTRVYINGKWCQDTTHFPPFERLKQIGDSSTPEYSFDTLPSAIYLMKCHSCEPVIEATFKVMREIRYINWALYLDSLTNKHYLVGMGYWSAPMGKNYDKIEKVGYLLANKQPLPTDYFFIKEKEFP